MEDEFKCIETHKNRYVLDIDMPGTPRYADRRAEILRRGDKPYDIYPLNKRITDMSGILESKSKTFIDANGKILKWKPKKFYKVTCHLIEYSHRTPDGYYCIKPKGVEARFVVESLNGCRYVQIVNVGVGVKYLFKLVPEMVGTTRKKL
jgi:hypothetical protein